MTVVLDERPDDLGLLPADQLAVVVGVVRVGLVFFGFLHEFRLGFGNADELGFGDVRDVLQLPPAMRMSEADEADPDAGGQRRRRNDQYQQSCVE